MMLKIGLPEEEFRCYAVLECGGAGPLVLDRSTKVRLKHDRLADASSTDAMPSRSNPFSISAGPDRRGRAVPDSGHRKNPVTMFGFMKRNNADHHIGTITPVLGLSKSGFNARRWRPKTVRAMEDEVLADTIIRIHADSRGNYGAPRVRAELRLAHGISCSRRRVARIIAKRACGASRGAACTAPPPPPSATRRPRPRVTWCAVTSRRRGLDVVRVGRRPGGGALRHGGRTASG